MYVILVITHWFKTNKNSTRIRPGVTVSNRSTHTWTLTQGGYLEMHQAGQEAASTDKPITKCPKNMSEAGYRCVCLNARSIINKKNELNIMVEDIDPTQTLQMLN